MNAGSGETITLAAARLRLEVFPAGGGSIVRFTRQDRSGVPVDLMRPASRPAIEGREPLGMSCFPLVPYCDLVTGGAFTFDGVRHVLPRNHPALHEPIHGEGWISAWSVERRAGDALLLRLDHGADEPGFPFSYSASLLFELGDETLAIELALHNDDARPMPCGIGTHPYYVRTPDLIVRVGTGQVWPAEATKKMLAAIPVPPEWDYRAPRQLGDVDLDHTFAGWDGRYDVVWPSLATGLTVTADPVFRNLQIFVPRGGDHFCMEPISNAMDAFNLASLGLGGHDVSILHPGHTVSGRVRFRTFDYKSAT